MESINALGILCIMMNVQQINEILQAKFLVCNCKKYFVLKLDIGLPWTVLKIVIHFSG
jgi:hypothetical protein